MPGLADLWSPIRLTLALASITTVLLLVVGTPIAWWLARSQGAVEGGGRRARGAAARAAADGPRLLSSRRIGPERAGRLDRRPFRRAHRSPSRSRRWSSDRFSTRCRSWFSRSAIAFEAIGERPLEVAATLRASPWDAFWTVAVPLARPGFMTGAVLGFAHTVGEFGVVLMIGGNIPGRRRCSRSPSTITSSPCSGRRLISWRPACWYFRSWSSSR